MLFNIDEKLALDMPKKSSVLAPIEFNQALGGESIDEIEVITLGSTLASVVDELPDWDEVPVYEDTDDAQSPLPLAAKASFISVQEVREKWETIKRRIKTKKDGSMIAAISNDYTIMDVENTHDIPVLILKAAAKFHYDTLMKNERYKTIEWALGIELDRECQVRLLPPKPI